MQESQNYLITQTTLVKKSSKNENNTSQMGIITLEQEYIDFQSILPIKVTELNRYMICLCQQIIEIQYRNIFVEQINLQTLQILPQESRSYLFFFKESYETQNFLQNIKILLTQLGYDNIFFNEANKIQEILFKLVQQCDVLLNDQNLTICQKFRSEQFQMDFLKSQNNKKILFQRQNVPSSMDLISKLNCEDKNIRIDQKKDYFHFKYKDNFLFEKLTWIFPNVQKYQDLSLNIKNNKQTLLYLQSLHKQIKSNTITLQGIAQKRTYSTKINIWKMNDNPQISQFQGGLMTKHNQEQQKLLKIQRISLKYLLGLSKITSNQILTLLIENNSFLPQYIHKLYCYNELQCKMHNKETINSRNILEKRLYIKYYEYIQNLQTNLNKKEQKYVLKKLKKLKEICLRTLCEIDF